MTFTWQPVELDALDSETMIDRLLVAAQHELAEEGILGFRTLRVAQRANCSVSLIYRYFVDRDGLIIRVLGDMFTKLQHEYVDDIIRYVEGSKKLSPSDIISLVPDLDKIGDSANMKWRMMALSISMHNQELKSTILSSIESVKPKWMHFFDLVSKKLEKGAKIDFRVFTMILSMSLPYYNTLLGEASVDDASYRKYLNELIVKKNSR